MSKRASEAQDVASPVLEIVTDESGPGIRFRVEGSGRAFEVVDGLGSVLFAVDKTGMGSPEAPAKVWPAAVPQSMVTTFASGHGYTTNGAGVASSNLNDTNDYALGSQSVSITTAANNQAAQIRKLAGSSLDLTGKSVAVWLKVDDITHLQSIDLYIGSSSLANFYRFRLQTQGTASTYYINSGEWVRLVVNWGDLTQTSGAPVRTALTDWQISVKDDGLGAVTYHVGGISSVAEPSTKWANGVVSLVFDDGWLSQFNEARKKMDTYGFPGTAYIIRDLIDNNVNNMTMAQLKQLQEQSGWQIAAHADTVASHNTRYVNLTQNQTEAEFRNLKAWLRQNGFGGGDDFAYPGGDFNPAVLAAARKYFRSARTIIDVTHETIPVPNLLRLRAHTTISTDTTAAIQTLIDNAFANKHWLILLFHEIVTSPGSSTQYSIANFGTIIDYLNTKGIPVATVADVLKT